MRVLIVEDSEDSRILLEAALEGRSFLVETAGNGIEALARVKKNVPDLIISDILMPEMDGFELCRQLKDDPIFKGIPFIFYTATYTEPADERFAMSLGADRFMQKPQDPVTVIDVINQVLEEKSLEYESRGVESLPRVVYESIHISRLQKKLNSKIELLERQKEELQLKSLVFQNSTEGMMVTDQHNKIIAINPAYTSITGYSFDEVKGENPAVFASGKHNRAFFKKMWAEISAAGSWQGEVWDCKKNGEDYVKWLSIKTIRNAAGDVYRYVAIFSDITDKKKSEELIRRQANYDALTNLPNRNMFRNCLETKLQISGRGNLPLALLIIDLDLFKEINDTLGHEVGDMLLKDAASRISGLLRDTDIVARLGGDEFAVILSEIVEIKHVDDVAARILIELSKPYRINRDEVYISGSIGITLSPNDSSDIDELIKNADQAMYEAKRRGRNCFSYFTPSMQELAQKRLRTIRDLRDALVANQFSVYYQPIIDLATGQIKKAEGLARWLHPKKGLIAPNEFIPLAEETGVINQLGSWVFKEATRQIAEWNNQHQLDLKISINMSPVQYKMENKKYTADWLDHIGTLGLSGSNIVLEITEGLLLHAEKEITDQLLAYRDQGINIAIDDFGTGYSSLSYLKKFDIDFLKIDRLFVQNLGADTDDLILCEAIIVMAHKLGLKVIAEGVETSAQADLLVRAGCDYAQGYLYAKPMPGDEFAQFLKNNGSSSDG
ncbi:two-component system response regulator [Teredinibacter haidensis]|uniref:two-component system response regulator n=1 Tax=Teredinibacter haidensis TaxID=2731755 RepID=UPI000948BFBD|nr:EAL domain-containing protein [Teredinibacter haidensis]